MLFVKQSGSRDHESIKRRQKTSQLGATRIIVSVFSYFCKRMEFQKVVSLLIKSIKFQESEFTVEILGSAANSVCWLYFLNSNNLRSPSFVHRQICSIRRSALRVWWSRLEIRGWRMRCLQTSRSFFSPECFCIMRTSCLRGSLCLKTGEMCLK